MAIDKNTIRTHGRLIREGRRELTTDILYELSFHVLDLRSRRDKMFYGLFNDMFGNNVNLNVNTSEQRYRSYEYEHIARVLFIILDPERRTTLLKGMGDLCDRYESEIAQLRNAKNVFVRPYLIGNFDDVPKLPRRYSSVEDLLEQLKNLNVEKIPYEDVLLEVLDGKYDGDLKNGITALACLTNRYKIELHTMCDICFDYFSENTEDLSLNEKERVNTYIKWRDEPTKDEIEADAVWSEGILDCTENVLKKLANVCMRYRNGIKDLSQVYAVKRKQRDDRHIKEVMY